MGILDVFDEHFQKTGVASRQEVHEKGLWHQTFHCWVVSRGREGILSDPSEGAISVALQLRHMQKDTNPGLLDVSCAGHLMAGEEAADGLRELEEELGYRTTFEHLVSLGIYREEAMYTDPAPLVDREFCHVFYVQSQLDLWDYRPQPDEVSGLYQANLSDLIDLFSDRVASISIDGYQVGQDGRKNDDRRLVTKQDFVARPAAYYVDLLQQIHV